MRKLKNKILKISRFIYLNPLQFLIPYLILLACLNTLKVILPKYESVLAIIILIYCLICVFLLLAHKILKKDPMELKFKNNTEKISDYFNVDNKLLLEIDNYIFFSHENMYDWNELIENIINHFQPILTDTQMAFVFFKIGVLKAVIDIQTKIKEDKKIIPDIFTITEN